MSTDEWAAINSLRSKGYAVCIFAPEELGDAVRRTVEDALCVRGWEVIEDLNPPGFLE